MPEARTLVAGTAEGRALVLDEPLSFWGGIDPANGDIIDARHPQHGANVAGRILVMPSGRGSSSSSSVLAEAIRAGTAPAAIVMSEADPILALGAIVARELFGTTIPVIVTAGSDLRTDDLATVRADETGVDVRGRGRGLRPGRRR
jgi:predicted aconitase with swiveling domain